MENQQAMCLNIHGSLLARNALLNLLGQGLPLIVAVVTTPFLIRGLGAERFGVLALAWTMLGYFNIFDLGLGRAVTKFVAEVLGKGDQRRVPTIVWTTVGVQAAFGILGGLVLVGLTPLLVERFLNIPQGLIDEARLSFHILALSVPTVLIANSFCGVLEAAQRFDLVNAVKAPFSAANFLLPLAGVLWDWSLPGVVALLVASKALALLFFAWLCLKTIPLSSRQGALFQKEVVRLLFGFGKWVMVSNLVASIFLYLDRFLIGSLMTVTAVAYYTVPQEVIVRLLIIPMSLVMTLFPAFSTLRGINNRRRIEKLFTHSVKSLFLIMGPLVMALIFFSREVLYLWLGEVFAEHSKIVLQALAVSALIQAIAQIPLALIQGLGYPQVITKIQLIVLPLYSVGAAFLIMRYGIVGAALAAAARALVQTLAYFRASRRILNIPSALAEQGIARMIPITSMAALALLLLIMDLNIEMRWPAKIVVFVASTFLGCYSSWRFGFDSDDRAILKTFLNRLDRRHKQAKDLQSEVEP